MAGKNTAVFGIYRNKAGVENAVEALKNDGFRNTDISVLFPENEGTKDFAHERARKLPKALRLALARGRLSAALWAGWRESEHSKSPDSGRSSLPGLSWRHWRASRSEGRSED
jgi:hypothetical protein